MMMINNSAVTIESGKCVTKIDDLCACGRISKRLANCLRRAGYMTVEDVIDVDPGILMRIRNFGHGCLEEVERLKENYQTERAFTLAMPTKEEKLPVSPGDNFLYHSVVMRYVASTPEGCICIPVVGCGKPVTYNQAKRVAADWFDRTATPAFSSCFGEISGLSGNRDDFVEQKDGYTRLMTHEEAREYRNGIPASPNGFWLESGDGTAGMVSIVRGTSTWLSGKNELHDVVPVVVLKKEWIARRAKHITIEKIY